MKMEDVGMQGLLQDIKSKTYSSVYLLCGEEVYLRKQYRDRLREALSEEGDTMNTHYYEGKHIPLGEVTDLAQTMPFFAERRVIIIENSGWIQKGGEQMATYLPKMPDSTVLIFVEEQIDKRSKLYKTIKAKGRITEFTTQDEQTLKKWIWGMLKKEGKKITDLDLQYLLEKTGTEMSHIKMEIEKLLCYVMNKEIITREDIDAICVKRIQNQIFEMINAIASGEQKKALQLYYDLLTLKEPPMRILALIGRQFNLLLQVKELKKKGYSTKTISEKTGLHSFIVGKYVKQAEGFKTKELRQALEDCVKTDEQVKTGQMQDIMSVELLIVKYSC